MSQKNLKQKAASGMVWTALQKYSTMFIQFISGIILARLLTPYDYGCIGMLMIFMVLAEAFIDGGFGSALIQKKRPTQEDYSTIFWWNLSMAVVLYVVLYFSAPAIARFYDIPLLCDVLRVQGIVLFIYAFNIIQRNQLRKELNFKILSIITITTSVIALTTTIIMAYHGYGVWALVAQHLLTAFIPALVFWFYIKWRPILVFSVKSFKELFSFGFYIFLNNFFVNFSRQIQGLLIGKFYNPAIMGYYSKAHSTEKLASHSISQVLTQVTFPLYSEVQDDKRRMINILEQLIGIIAYMTFPLIAVLILIAKPLFILLYSDRWLDSVPYFQILCLAGLGICLQSVNLQTISAVGKSRTVFVWSVIKQTIGIILAVGGLLFFGINGLLWGAAIHSWSCLLINMYLVSRHIGYNLKSQLWSLFPVTAVTLVAFLASYLVGKELNLGLYISGGIKFIIFAIIYLGWTILFKPKPFCELRTLAFSKLKKKHGIISTEK